MGILQNHINKKLILILCLLIYFSKFYNPLEGSDFKIGEILVYNIYAEGIKVGYQVIKLNSIFNKNGRKIIELKGHSKSAPFVSLLYRLNDKWRILIDTNTLKPIRIEKDMIEGKKSGYIIYEINQDKLLVTINNTTDKKRKIIKAKNAIYDFISMVYNFRKNAILYSKIGKSITFDFLESNCTRTVSFINIGKASLPNVFYLKNDYKKIDVFVFKQTRKPGIVFYVESNNNNNNNYLPLKMEVKARLSRNFYIKITAELKKYNTF